MIDKLSFLKGGSEGSSVSAEEERLMQLFQNRAGLKKAYADLKDEFHLLRDRLKQQEGATIRVQEQLDALGDLLADPRTGFGALVFFQLRGLWKTCHQQLSAVRHGSHAPAGGCAKRRSTSRSARRHGTRGSPTSISGLQAARRGGRSAARAARGRARRDRSA